MEILKIIVNILKTYLFDQPAILMGMVALIGLIAQKKAFEKVIEGTLKTIIGFMIMSAGAGMIAGTVFPIAAILEKIIGIEVSTSGIGTDAFIGQWGSVITMIMGLGFFVNLLLARFTRFKYIYLTGHQMFWVIFLYLGVTVQVVPNLNTTTAVIVGSILAGLYFTFQPAITQPFMRKVTGNNSIAYGHTTSFGVIIGSLVGQLVGDKEKSSEDINIPDKISFLKDITISTSIIMIILYTVCVALATPSYVEETISGGQPAFLFAMLQGLTFSVGITILLMGVGMMISEIVPAFKGFAEKVVPNAIPALDCPLVFNFAPTAVMLGFLSCLGTVIVCIILFGLFGFYALTPAVITTFFGGGPAGVFGNSTGGWKGAIAAGIVAGLLISFGQAFTVPVVSNTVADFARWSNDFDYSVFPALYHYFVKLVSAIF